jgi:hypothetical protein
MPKYDKRHHYSIPDKRESTTTFKRRRKARLQGMPIENKMLQYYHLIEQYAMRRHNLNRMDLHFIMYLSGYERCFEKRDAKMFPSGYGRCKFKTQFNRLIRDGFIQRFEGHNMNRKRQVQYRLSKISRLMITDMYDRMYMTKKIPLEVRYSDYDFVTKKSELDNNRKPNYYALILEFNQEVEKRKMQS